MKYIAVVILFFTNFIVSNCQSLRDEILGVYSSIYQTHDQTGYFTGSDPLYIDTSASDTNNIIVTDSVGWLNYEYLLHSDSSFEHIFVPTLKYGYFYSNGDSIFLHDVFNSPWFREWRGGRIGAGIHEAFYSRFSISPNPARNRIFISSEKIFTKMKIELFNSLGQSVLDKSISPIQNKTEIDLPNLPNGIYYLKMETENNFFSQKIVIQN
jgi:hypothetical protein